MTKSKKTFSQLMMTLLLASTFFVQCSKDDDKEVTGPQVTKTYYIKFKADGVTKIFEDGNPGFQGCGECACSYLPVLDQRRAGIDVCNASSDWITDLDIEGWNGDKFLFNTDNVFPVAKFGFTENEISYHTDYVESQTDSEVNITEVTSEANTQNLKAYKVKGNFKCKVAKTDGLSLTTITEGEFVVRYTETF